VLWVKGSGGDLRTQAREFLLALPGQADRAAEIYARASRTRAEDAHRGRMVGCTPHHVQPQPARLLDRHAAAQLRPGKHVDHMHPNAAIAIAASKNCEELTKKIYGDE
jgi:rhamnose utilization protein RhaD (predicted bifunctional aldolase and dehydrogenase)